MLGADFYAALVVIVVGLIAAATAALAGMLLRHSLVALRLRAHASRRDTLLPLVCQAVDDPARKAELIGSLRRGDRAVLLPLLLQLALDLRGEERDRVAEIAEIAGIARTERRRLQRGLATARAEAAKNLGLLRVRAALAELLGRLCADAEPSVRLACTWAVGEIGGPSAVQGLLARLDDPAPGVVRRAQEVLLDAAPGAAREIVRHVRPTQSRTARYAAVELLGALRDPAASELLLGWADDSDAELRTRVAKAAAAIADPRFRETFRLLIRDPEWSVRCQAATGLGAIGATDAIAELRNALVDEAWWVRFNAASALAELGGAGRAALASAAADSDVRRREVARYVMQRAAIVPLAA